MSLTAGSQSSGLSASSQSSGLSVAVATWEFSNAFSADFDSED